MENELELKYQNANIVEDEADKIDFYLRENDLSGYFQIISCSDQEYKLVSLVGEIDAYICK